MDPEVKGWLDLLQGGGNAAAIVAVFIGWQVFKKLMDVLERIATRLDRVERAIVAGNPKANAIINEGSTQS